MASQEHNYKIHSWRANEAPYPSTSHEDDHTDPALTPASNPLNTPTFDSSRPDGRNKMTSQAEKAWPSSSSRSYDAKASEERRPRKRVALSSQYDDVPVSLPPAAEARSSIAPLRLPVSEQSTSVHSAAIRHSEPAHHSTRPLSEKEALNLLLICINYKKWTSHLFWTKVSEEFNALPGIDHALPRKTIQMLLQMHQQYEQRLVPDRRSDYDNAIAKAITEYIELCAGELGDKDGAQWEFRLKGSSTDVAGHNVQYPSMSSIRQTTFDHGHNSPTVDASAESSTFHQRRDQLFLRAEIEDMANALKKVQDQQKGFDKRFQAIEMRMQELIATGRQLIDVEQSMGRQLNQRITQATYELRALLTPDRFVPLQTRSYRYP